MCFECNDPVYLYVQRYIWTLDPGLMELCFHINSCFPITTMPPSPPPTMSAHDQQAANRTAALPVVSAKSKSTGRKWQQSIADESVTKHNKTVGNESDDGSAVEEANDAEKEEKKGKKGSKLGTRGKRSIYFIFVSFVSFSSLTTYSRKTWADHQHEDNIENPKGTPAHPQPYVFSFLLFYSVFFFLLWKLITSGIIGLQDWV